MKGFRCWAPGPVLQLCQSASNTAASDKSQHAHVAPQGRRRPARLRIRALAFAAGSGEGAAAETSFYGCSPGSRRHGVQDRSRPACLLIRARAKSSMTTRSAEARMLTGTGCLGPQAKPPLHVRGRGRSEANANSWHLQAGVSAVPARLSKNSPASGAMTSIP